jgi:uncharacterized protein (TIGR00251 family)
MRGRTQLRRDRRRGRLSARIAITVSPGARREEIVGRHGDGWKVRVAAAPERGRANEAVVALLAGTIGASTDAVRVVAGHTSRLKLVDIVDFDEEEAGRRLDAAARR